MKPDWFKPRGYSHLDAQVGVQFASRLTPALVERHSWSPLISYIKRTKRYKPSEAKTVNKDRLIMYASHRDACILSKYAADLSERLDNYYKELSLDQNVIAYRSLGKSNYHFSAEAHQFASSNSPCVVLCFDVTGFFDNLDHAILKDRLKRLLDVTELNKEWYSIFRHVTKFRHIDRDVIAKHSKFGPRLKNCGREPFATIQEVLAAGIKIAPNVNKFGIPQGTPISSVLSNAYLMDLDRAMAATCAKLGSFYQRYSDDILIVCKADAESEIEKTLNEQMKIHRLSINADKVEKVLFDISDPRTFQYLGFNISPDGAMIRPGSVSRQWRKAKRSVARTKKIGAKAVAEEKATKIFTKKLRRRFSPVGVRNFSSYARRSAEAFGSVKIVRQIRRLERKMDSAIRDIEK